VLDTQHDADYHAPVAIGRITGLFRPCVCPVPAPTWKQMWAFPSARVKA